jgi:hypothetical protein
MNASACHQLPGFDVSPSHFYGAFFHNSNYRFLTPLFRNASVSCFLILPSVFEASESGSWQPRPIA